MINSVSFKWLRAALFLSITGICASLTIVLSASLLTSSHLAAQEINIFEDPANSEKTDEEISEELRKQLELEKQKLASEKQKLEAIEDEKRGVNQKVISLDKERTRLNKLLINFAKRIQTSESALTKLEGRLENLHKKEKRVRKTMAARRQDIGEMLGLLQRMGRNPPPIMATHRDDALKMVRSAMLMSTMLPKLKTQADTLKSELDSLIDLKSSIAKQSELLRVQNAEMESDRTRIKELLDQKNERILSHNKILIAFESRVKEHAKSVNNIEQLVKKVDREIQDKTELGAYEDQIIADEKIAAAKMGVKPSVNLSPSEKQSIAFVNAGRIKPALPFSRAKKTLPFPVRGTRLRSWGERMKFDEISKGISIETRSGAQIISPADGWVVYAGKFRKYGQLLIINTGEGYHVLLAGMDRIDVITAQFVLAGEPIGIMADTSKKQKGNKEERKPVLYVEFRKKGQPINPNPWWAEEIAQN